MVRVARNVILAACLALASTPAVPKSHPPGVGDIAPDVELTLVSGEKVRLSELKGQVVVLNFWATWCVPCRAELPLLDTYYKLQKKHGLKVYAITTEGSVPERKLHDLFDVMSIEPVRKMKGPYNYLEGVPTNFVIDRAGKVRYAKAGAFKLAALNEILVPLLQEPAPSGT